MRFHVAMDSLEKENGILKAAVIALLVLVICLCVGLMRASVKNPLVIERGCLSKLVQPVSPEVTKDEVRSFLEAALKARFDSGVNQPGLLSPQQFAARSQEQTELAKQKFRQVVLIGDIEFKDKDVLVESDRLISAGDIRSAFRFPLRVEFEQVPRSDGNPYGLILTNVKVIEDQKTNEK